MTARQLTQSGAGMLSMYSAPARVYTVHTPAGMLPDGKTSKPFSSVEAFDGYVAQVRALGLVVSFDSPLVARVSKPAIAQ